MVKMLTCSSGAMNPFAGIRGHGRKWSCCMENMLRAYANVRLWPSGAHWLTVGQRGLGIVGLENLENLVYCRKGGGLETGK